jgi:hypothetical protein
MPLEQDRQVRQVIALLPVRLQEQHLQIPPELFHLLFLLESPQSQRLFNLVEVQALGELRVAVVAAAVVVVWLFITI